MSFPNLAFWWRLLAALAIEVFGVAALGFAAQRVFRHAYWQRSVWRTAVICLVLAGASEWTGFGRGAAGLLLHLARANKPGAPLLGASFSSVSYSQTPVMALPVSAPPRKLAVWWPARVWLAGTVIVLGRIASAQSLLIALRLRRPKIRDGALPRKVRAVAARVGLRRRVCLLRLPESLSPIAFGILRPCVGLPSGFETESTDSEQEAILAHELAHLTARDPLWFLAADWACALLWWHPLAWWARRSLHAASELAADESSALFPDGPRSLAKCLVALGKKMNPERGWGWIGINGGFRSKLGKRVERLMRVSNGDMDAPPEGWRGAAARIAATVIIAPALVLLFAAFQTAAAGQAENGWSESWRNSPGALVLLAALDDAGTQAEAISARIRRAKMDYEMGNLDEAETILKGVLVAQILA